MEGQQPGQVIVPQQQDNAPTPEVSPAEDHLPQGVEVQIPRDPVPAPEQPPAQPPTPEPQLPQQPAPELQPSVQPPTEEELVPQQFYTEDNYYDTPEDSTEDPPVEWTASEFVHHAKTAKWYVSLVGLTLVACALAYLLTRDYITVAVFAVVASLFGVMAARRPRVQQYRIDSGGITIGDKYYGFNEFKSFSIADEGPLSSISLLPLKRFMPMLSVYCTAEDEDRILDFLSTHLPFERRGQDLTEMIMRKIRF